MARRSGCGPEVTDRTGRRSPPQPHQFVRAQTRRRAPLCDRANLLLYFLGVPVAVPELVGDRRRNSTLGRIGFEIFDHPDFGVSETCDQLAGFNRRRLAVTRGLDQPATFLRRFAQQSRGG
jgi:hypothetical protein